MSRFLRLALPLVRLVAVTGCDAVVDVPEAAMADAAAHPILGPNSIPVCRTAGYSSLMDPDFTFQIVGQFGEAEILSQSIVNGQRRATVGGVSQGSVRIQLVDKYNTVRSYRTLTITPPQTTGGGIQICTY